MHQRELRRLDVDTDTARDEGWILEDETFIGIRVIDSSIAREKPTFVAYYEKSTRDAILVQQGARTVPTEIVAALEEDYTRANRVVGWQLALTRCIDSAQVHGRGVLEVVYDPNAPTLLSNEYVQPEDFIFPQKTRRLQSAPMVARRYTLSVMRLKELALRYGFDKTTIEDIIKVDGKEEGDYTAMHEIFHVFYKDGGLVYTFWYSKAKNKALSSVEKHNAGEQTMDGTFVPATLYPFFIFQYRVDEEEMILSSRGRAILDAPAQEALTSLWTNFVNGTNRASQLYPSIDQNSMPDAATEQIDFKLEHGKILNKPLKFHSPPWPQPIMLQAAQALETNSAQQSGQIDFAAQNRKDSRKTATEVQAAQQQSSLMSGVDVAMFALFLTQLHQYRFDIIRKNESNGITNVLIAQAPPEIRQAALAAKWSVRPAGDVDFIERSEKLARYMQMWPVLANTPAAVPILKEIVKLAFPNEAAIFLPFFEDNSKAVGQQLLEVIAAMPRDTMTPDENQQLDQIIDIGARTFGSNGAPPAAGGMAADAGSGGAAPVPQGQPPVGA